MRDLKYLTAYFVPLLSFTALYYKGWVSWITVVFVFIMVPVLEIFMNNSKLNLSDAERDSKSKKLFFDILLYCNIPIVYLMVGYYIYILNTYNYNSIELIGMYTAVGLTLASAGINVAHELGHRNEYYHRIMSKLLLLPSLYCHFIIEHNLGHHKNVGTDLDPASAKKNEVLYTFWLRSSFYSYLNAWNIEFKKQEYNKKTRFSLSNQMVVLTIIQMVFLAIIFSYGGLKVLIIYISTAIFSFLMLETINYIEHYGLRRQKLDNGRYERVHPNHSWNSNHELGRILLYELTRHSDHHYLANKKFQLLDHHDDAKQLPYGYPTSMLMAMVPPIWFKVMNKRI